MMTAEQAIFAEYWRRTVGRCIELDAVQNGFVHAPSRTVITFDAGPDVGTPEAFEWQEIIVSTSGLEQLGAAAICGEILETIRERLAADGVPA